ncbi:MAG: hypothetical protein LBL92_00445 [Propionibacteriaceae bacterium]|jgi:uncharacterized protein YdbL (DUF1318 family)|nr:hypothetical protein [Propionibacteriaceae bacterium]
MTATDVVFIAADGTEVTAAMLEKMMDTAEQGELPGTISGPLRPGRPVSVGDDEAAAVVAFRLGRKRQAKLKSLAQQRGATQSEVIRQLIDAA